MPSVNAADYLGEVQIVLVVAAPMPATFFGKLPVLLDGCRCTVSIGKPPSLTHDESGLEWKLESRDWCIHTVFSAADVEPTVLDKASGAVKLVDGALAAWNYASAWTKAKDRATTDHRLAPWLPRLGRLHVRAAAAWDGSGRVAGFVNPNSGDVLQAFGFLPLGDTFVTNGPAASPLPVVTEQLQEGLDLMNHGFVREALLSTFSTFEAFLRRELSDAIRISRNEELAPNRRVLKTVRDVKLRGCLSDLPVRTDIGWNPLDVAQSPLFDQVLEVAKTRNRIVHHGAQLSREEAEASLEVLWLATAWVLEQTGRNPSRYLPPANLAVPRFWLWRPGDPPMTADQTQ